MEVEEVQVKMEDEAKAGGNTSEKVLVDKEVLEKLISFFQNIGSVYYTDEIHSLYSNFYIVDDEHAIKYLGCDSYEGFCWLYYHENDYNYQKKHGLLCKYLSDKSYEEIKKIGETSAPGLYYNGVKISDLL